MKKSVVFVIFIALFSCKQEPKNIKLSGPIFGTGYNIQYYSEDNTNYQKQFDSLFNVVNQSLSTYLPESDISKLNRNEITKVDEHFKNVFKASKIIYRQTEGVFDPTIGNVVNAWNFGAEKNKFLTDSTTIDSLMRYVGFNRVGLVDGDIQKNKASYLEFNAIAKGYGIDVIANYLQSKGIDNYLVDIGGDMRVAGINLESKKGWTVGIDDPNFDGTQSYSKVVTLKDEALATSGTYRKFKTDDNGNRYAHIINTKTGYPSKTNILSVSVIAEDCMTADGFATAFQAMGIKKVEEFLERHQELKVYFIYEDDNKTLKTLTLNNFPE
ncbi:FAD:protein FMN transferase [Winogradskyella echinorum]|uniref:FAD:protein FMN transferase n=1 Tax=Winogradskyella echinorum TaxID=538189 RepID=A0ABR6XXC3_9FLAO|nr:FAD:protein FMN transferase [Winogradskyella echinorum]MBC3845117.1 FAD:protein FMN transferase [Winogradskyella echinorum]MBC5749465.1 FAD:protein FMN transferase [Winogradskyella echinorum]